MPRALSVAVACLAVAAHYGQSLSQQMAMGAASVVVLLTRGRNRDEHVSAFQPYLPEERGSTRYCWRPCRLDGRAVAELLADARLA